MGTTQQTQRPVSANPATGSAVVALDAAEIAAMPRHTVGTGASTARLWTRGRSHAGVMWLEAHARLEAHTHRRHAHHVWVVEGGITSLGRELGPGSFAYVPPGQEHELLAGSDGATFFYLYLDLFEEPPVVPV